MICGLSLVLFLSMMELGVVGEPRKVEAACGETAYDNFTCNQMTCNLNDTRINLTLEKNDTRLWATNKLSCSQNAKYCFNISQDGKERNLTVHNVSFDDQGKYNLSIEQHNKSEVNIIYLYVIGFCGPVFSLTADELTCEVKKKSTCKATISWMQKETQIKMKPYSENTTNDLVVRSSIKLTEENKKVGLCCYVSYEDGGEQTEKQICYSPNVLPNAESVVYEIQKETVIPVSCALIVGVAALCYIAYRLRRHLKRGSERKNLEESVQLNSSLDNV